MHPTGKAARVAGAVYLLLVVTAPFRIALAAFVGEMAIMLWLLVEGARVQQLTAAAA